MRRVFIGSIAALAGVGVFVAPGAVSAASAQVTPLTSISRDSQTVYYEAMSASPVARTGHGTVKADFDGDGLDDIVMSGWMIDVTQAALYTEDGFVTVQYSKMPRTDYFSGVMVGTGGCGCFGTSFTTGDFNHDGYDDLVIADSGEERPDIAGNVGGVWIFFGSATGLRTDTSVTHFNEDSAGIAGNSAEDDSFGTSVAAGDLNGDGYADLAIGTPMKSVGSVKTAGYVTVLYGSTQGLTSTGSVTFDENSTGVPGTAETDDRFGSTVAIGRVNSDKYADLAIGSIGEDETTGGGYGYGAVTLLWGSKTGVSFTGGTAVSGDQASYNTSSLDIHPDAIGTTLAIGDFNGDGLGDVITGSPQASVQQGDYLESPGVVLVFPGRSSGGLTTSNRQFISEQTTGVPGVGHWPDGFGGSISVGDVTGDGKADLVVGASGTTVGSVSQAGAFWLIPGSSHGLTGSGSVEISQDSPGVPGGSETGDRFGYGVEILNLDGKGGLDAVVTSPGEEVAGDTPGYPSGSATSFFASSGKLVAQTSWTGVSMATPDFKIMSYGTTIDS